MPYMEQQSLYDTVDLALPVFIGANGQPQQIVSTNVPTLHCPSTNELALSDTRNMAYTNYAGSEGYHWWTSAMLGNWDPWDKLGFADHTADLSGLFTIEKTRKISDIKDGTSNTVIVTEVTSNGYKNGPIRTNGTGLERLNTAGERVFRAAFVWTGVSGRCCESGLYRDPAGGSTWWFPAGGPHAFSPTYITAYGINANWPGVHSGHPGGVNSLLGDGAVRFISETMNWSDWCKLNGIEDRYIVSQF